MDSTNQYIQANKDRFLEELIELLKIPSVSADPAYDQEVAACAEVVKDAMEEAGVDHVEICPTAGHPIVYGEKIVDENLPTVLVYGHYDVQPADPLELWDSPPFDPVIKNEKIYARGAADDKGQMFMHVKAVEAMIATSALPCNVKFMIEGEEEVGSENLGIFVAENKEKLKADVILISDTSMLSNENPSITVGLRGLSYVEIELTGPNRDLHSGVYGGAVDNPINALSEMIAKMKDEHGHITVDGFYDDVEEVSKADREAMARAPFDIQSYKEHLGINATKVENGFSEMEGASIRPTLDVNGMWGGYTGEGAKTVLPSKAYAKISMRLVPNQDPEKITELFTEYVQKITPSTMSVKVTPHHGGQPAVTPTDSVAYQAASKAIETTYGKTPIPLRSGGSIPIVALFESELGLKSILLGFGLDSDAIHSPNESYGLFNFFKGIETIPHFFKNFAANS